MGKRGTGEHSNNRRHADWVVSQRRGVLYMTMGRPTSMLIDVSKNLIVEDENAYESEKRGDSSAQAVATYNKI